MSGAFLPKCTQIRFYPSPCKSLFGNSWTCQDGHIANLTVRYCRQPHTLVHVLLPKLYFSFLSFSFIASLCRGVLCSNFRRHLLAHLILTSLSYVDSPVNMARTKAIPLRREPSDFDQGPPDTPNYGWKHMDRKSNGNVPPATLSNGKPKGPSRPATQEQAGLAQLVICVAGIYASL